MALDERIKVAFKTVAGKQRGYLTFDNSAISLAGRLPSSGSPIVSPDPQTTRDLIKAKIRELARYDNNLFKWWIFFYPHYYQHRSDRETFYSPFLRRPGGRWDLLAPNDVYYEALDLAIRESMRYGIVVEIGLFDGPGFKATGVSDAFMRWDWNPWNAKNNAHGTINTVRPDGTENPDGASKVFFTDSPIRQYQQKYVEEVIWRTKEYWNVVYEIINEPGGNVTEEISWANQVVGWMHAKTGGQRLLFYNTFPNEGDITEFRKKNANGQYIYANYPNFHGVIFHGDPTGVDPANPNYPFSAEKAFQASSDGGPDPDRETTSWNKSRTEHCFSKDMSFQAHSISIEAGQGISAALTSDQRRTLPLVPWKLIGRFHRRVPDEAFDVRFYMDGSYVGFTTNPPAIIDRGKYSALGRDGVKTVRGDGVQRTWQYTLDDGGPVPRLKMTRDDGFHQELDQVVYTGQLDEPVYYDFLFNWERVFSSDSSPNFNLRFDVDHSFIAYQPGPPAVDLQRGDVMGLGHDAQGDFIIFFSADRGEQRWAWRFLDEWKTLELSRPGFTQRFAKRDAFRPVF